MSMSSTRRKKPLNIIEPYVHKFNKKDVEIIRERDTRSLTTRIAEDIISVYSMESPPIDVSRKVSITSSHDKDVDEIPYLTDVTETWKREEDSISRLNKNFSYIVDSSITSSTVTNSRDAATHSNSSRTTALGRKINTRDGKALPYTCRHPTCGKSYSMAFELLQHENKHHSLDQSFNKAFHFKLKLNN